MRRSSLLGELYEQKGDIEKALANYQHSLLLDASEPNNHCASRSCRCASSASTRRSRRRERPGQDSRRTADAVPARDRPEPGKAAHGGDDGLCRGGGGVQQNHEELLNASFYFSYGAAAEQAGLTEKRPS